MSSKGHETAVVYDQCTKCRLSCSWLDKSMQQKLCVTCHDKKLTCTVNSVLVSQGSKWKSVEGLEEGNPRVEKRVQVEV